MFSHSLYEALCQTQQNDVDAVSTQSDDPSVMQAIERAMEAYQRLFVGPDAIQ